MLQINKILCNVFDENCYIIHDTNNLEGIIIDPGSNFEDIYLYIKQNNLSIKAVLLTHGHFDHIMSCRKLQMLGYKIYISEHDAPMCQDNDLNFSTENGFNIDTFKADVLIGDDENKLALGSFDINVLHVSGHSKGGLAYIIENNLFSGDTLFEHGYGRTDLKGGNFREILASIKLLRSYTKNGSKLYPGHDY